jgi:hypothetical protein
VATCGVRDAAWWAWEFVEVTEQRWVVSVIDQ